MSITELAEREDRAQQGIVQFAEEMQAIRDERIYPDAWKESAWENYCKTRWSLGHSRVNAIIAATPVLRRRAEEGVESTPSVEKARIVATLPIAVQDAILTAEPKAVAEDDVKAKAKAARKVIKTAEAEAREATDDELIAAVADVKSTKPRSRPRARRTKFTVALTDVLYYAERAADISQGDTLTDTENDDAHALLAKIRYQLDRVEGKLKTPEHAKDIDAEFAVLLSGDES